MRQAINKSKQVFNRSTQSFVQIEHATQRTVCIEYGYVAQFPAPHQSDGSKQVIVLINGDDGAAHDQPHRRLSRLPVSDTPDHIPFSNDTADTLAGIGDHQTRYPTLSQQPYGFAATGVDIDRKGSSPHEFPDFIMKYSG